MTEHGRFHRFYFPGDVHASGLLELGDAASHQIKRVLRLRQGDTITLFDGNGLEVDGSLVRFSRSSSFVEIVDTPRRGITPGGPEIHLGVALLKSDRFDLVVQKATELGVTSITALECARCVVSLSADRARSRLERWQKVAIEALEQSGRADYASVHEVRSLDSFLQKSESDAKLIAWEEEQHSSIAERISPSVSSVSMVIGPEGGFTESEVHSAQSSGFRSVSLGPTTLRSETAAIAAVAMINMVHELHRLPTDQ